MQYNTYVYLYVCVCFYYTFFVCVRSQLVYLYFNKVLCNFNGKILVSEFN